jgi:hypothetical protein
MADRPFGLAIGRIDMDDRRRVGATPRPVIPRNEAKADVFAYIESFYNPQTQALGGRLSKPYGVRAESRIRLTACHPNRVQASNNKPIF